MKAWFLGPGVIAAAVSLAVGPHTASAVDQLGGAFTQIAVAHAGLGSILVDGRGRSALSVREGQGRQERLQRAVRSLTESRLPCSARSEGQTDAFRRRITGTRSTRSSRMRARRVLAVLMFLRT